MNIFKILASKFPGLGLELRKANMLYSPEEFVKRTFMTAFYMSIAIVFIFFMMLANFVEKKQLLMLLAILFPILLFIMFVYFYKIPQIKIKKLERAIDREIIFAGRFLIVELESGVPIYDTLKNMGRSYKVAGAYFREIIEKVSIGTSLEDAINEAVEIVPSPSLRRILWQIANSMHTGSDVVKPLHNVVETLIREQQIAVNEYGRKLNPLAMFYMLIAIIVPSLGITLLTIISIFVGLELRLPILLSIVGLMAFIQFMFVAIINSSRPAVDL